MIPALHICIALQLAAAGQPVAHLESPGNPAMSEIPNHPKTQAPKTYQLDHGPLTTDSPKTFPPPAMLPSPVLADGTETFTASSEETSGTADSGPHETPAAEILSDRQQRIGNERLDMARQALPFLRSGMSRNQAAHAIGITPVALSRLLALAPKHGAERISSVEACRRVALLPVEQLASASHQGKQSAFASLARTPGVIQKLRELMASVIGASSEGMANDRRTARVAAALKLFSVETECPPDLAEKLRQDKFPLPLVRLCKQMTPELEALLGGPKKFQLHGPSGWRDRGDTKTIGLPDGRRAQMIGNWTVQFDDMSVNQPFWVDRKSVV